MTQSTDRLDRLVEDYLGAVSYACADLPPDRRDDLIADLREHIAAAREVLYQPTEAAVRTILDRLGEPAAIAGEARLTEGLGPTMGSAPVREPDRSVGRGHWLARPMSPVTLAILLGFIFTVAMVALALVLREPPAPVEFPSRVPGR